MLQSQWSMRCALLFLACVAILLRSCAPLPFGSEEGRAEAAGEADPAVRGAASAVAKKEAPDAGSIVEAYFQSGGGVGDDASDALKEAVRKMADDSETKAFLRETRRSLHRHPDLMYEESFASETIRTVLDELGISYTTGWAKNTHLDSYPGPGGYGVVANIGTGDPDGPCVILRADMDALPIKEATEGIDDFKSENPGKMHACGHDGHVTMLLGAAALLKKVEAGIVGTVRLVFQPAEEGGAGMKRMIEEGVVDLPPRASQAYGLHVWPALPTGAVASRAGPLLAAAEMFEIRVRGKGGHAAMPHLTIDPIVAAASLVTNLQTIVSRSMSPLESGVVSVTQISAGDAFNVIPASATLKGTARALSVETLEYLRDRIATMADATAALHGCDATIQFSPDFYPPTTNDEGLFAWSKEVGALVSREGMLRDVEPTMGGEDFAFMAQTIPSTFFIVGQGSGGKENEKYHVPRTDYGLHHPSFALDEDVLPIGTELHVNLALRALKKLSMDGENAAKAEL